jgi:hypothetical protein
MSDPHSKAKAARKEEKELKKALETQEEKRARRLAKKESKERKRQQLMNPNNIFEDDRADEAFIWTKKYEKMGMKDLDAKEMMRDAYRIRKESEKEIEAVKLRRIQREKEMEERREEMMRIQREKEMAQFDEFGKQEDTFHLKQARLRSKIRIRDGRAKPIDHLAQYYDVFTEPVKEDDPTFIPKKDEDKQDEEEYLLSRIEIPYEILNGLRRVDLEDLLEDINVYKELEKNRDLSFWNDMTVIVEDELAKLRNYASRSTEDRREGINPAVEGRINGLLQGKSPKELSDLQAQVEKKISDREEGIDITYWETILSKLKAFMAKARLKEQHDKNMRLRLERLELIKPKESSSKQTSTTSSSRDKYGSSSRHSDRDRYRSSHHSDRDRHHRDRDRKRERDSDRKKDCREDKKKDQPEVKIEAEVKPDQAKEPIAGPSGLRQETVSTEVIVGQEHVTEEEEEEDVKTIEAITEEVPELTLIEECKKDYINGRYSPELLPFDSHQVSGGTLVFPEVDERNRYLLRLHTQRKHSSTAAASLTSAAESAFDSEARKGMNKDEVQFSVEEAIRQDKSVLSWSEKYKARKPRYFNRVHTGFEWNKYNQTHYDTDNPPPKLVQGYKFNLFYPDLIDKNKAPKYTITPCSDNGEFAIIRFSAGPPYEDIAFKIVNREWNYSHRSGFRSQFSNGILQLWFHFKRYRYRR